MKSPIHFFNCSGYLTVCTFASSVAGVILYLPGFPANIKQWLSPADSSISSVLLPATFHLPSLTSVSRHITSPYPLSRTVTSNSPSINSPDFENITCLSRTVTPTILSVSSLIIAKSAAFPSASVTYIAFKKMSSLFSSAGEISLLHPPI